jgi:hypothetical protein
VTLSGGKDRAATWEIVEVERDTPTFSEQVRIMTAVAIAVDKIQVLTGGVTSRVGIQIPDRIPEYEEALDRTLRIVQDKAS